MLSQFICKEWLDQAFWLKPLGLVKKNSTSSNGVAMFSLSGGNWQNLLPEATLFVLPTTGWRFTKIKYYVVLKNTQVVIQSDQGNEWINYMEKYRKETQLLFLRACILEKECWRQGKIIGIKHLKLLSKDNNGWFL